MSFDELVSVAQALPRADKIRLVHALVVQLAREEGVPLVPLSGAYPVWTPYHAYEAAATLLEALGTASAEA